jgi:hypothetical protein
VDVLGIADHQRHALVGMHSWGGHQQREYRNE